MHETQEVFSPNKSCKIIFPQNHYEELPCFPTAADDTFQGQLALLLLEIPNVALHEATYTSMVARAEIKLCGSVFPCHPPLLFLNMKGVAGEV